MNLYAYVLGNPVNGTDRSGLDGTLAPCPSADPGDPNPPLCYTDDSNWRDNVSIWHSVPPLHPIDEYDPQEALNDLIRNGMLLMDGTQRRWAINQAIEQERRIMQADLDEQDRLAAEGADQNTTTTTPGDQGEGSGTGSGTSSGDARRTTGPAILTDGTMIGRTGESLGNVNDPELWKLGMMPSLPPGVGTWLFGLSSRNGFLFGTRGVLNHGQWLRIGQSRLGGEGVFRIGGRLVEKWPLSLLANTPDGLHIVLFNYGPL